MIYSQIFLPAAKQMVAKHQIETLSKALLNYLFSWKWKSEIVLLVVQM